MSLAWCDSAVSALPTPYGLAFDVLGDCSTTIGDIAYTLQTVRLLLPSAHRLWRHPSPLEAQFAHEAECGDRLVLAALFREGESSPDVRAAARSLLLEEASVRLIDLIPLSRCYFVHDACSPSDEMPTKEIHMVSASEMTISSEHLAELRAR